MTKAKLINIIDNILDFLTNGSVIRDNIIYNGHPNFYLKHSKEEFEKELEAIVKDKESYDRYDLYYYTNYMFKYMLNEYDSHTKMFFMDHKLLPIKIRFINNIPYIDKVHLRGLFSAQISCFFALELLLVLVLIFYLYQP